MWTALYLLMSVAAWFVWRAAGWAGAAGTSSAFLAQQVCNAGAGSSPWRRGALPFADIVLLLGLIVATIVVFDHPPDER